MVTSRWMKIGEKMSEKIDFGQVAPVANERVPSWELVIQDMRSRDDFGRKKYGTPLQPLNGRDSMKDAYEEVLDLAVYLRNAIEERNIKADKADRASDLVQRYLMSDKFDGTTATQLALIEVRDELKALRL